MMLADLPTLTIVSIDSDSVRAMYSDAKWIGERHIVVLIRDGNHFIWGRLSAISKHPRSCTFTPDEPQELSALQIGQMYPQMDGYWGERAELVLNRSIQWQERIYAPTDGVWFEKSRTMRQHSDEVVPQDGTLVSGGWDHEHCDICWATISEHQNRTAVFAAPRTWLCKDCYDNFVVAQSLNFIVDAPAKPWWKFW